jgi:hypothetical protein
MQLRIVISYQDSELRPVDAAGGISALFDNFVWPISDFPMITGFSGEFPETAHGTETSRNGTQGAIDLTHCSGRRFLD